LRISLYVNYKHDFLEYAEPLFSNYDIFATIFIASNFTFILHYIFPFYAERQSELIRKEMLLIDVSQLLEFANI